MTTATKGADLDRRMYALGPTALADEAARLLWDDGRRSLYEGDAAGCDAAAAPGLTPLQREVLGAATLLRRLCDEGPEWRVAACEALAAASGRSLSWATRHERANAGLEEKTSASRSLRRAKLGTISKGMGTMAKMEFSSRPAAERATPKEGYLYCTCACACVQEEKLLEHVRVHRRARACAHAHARACRRRSCSDVTQTFSSCARSTRGSAPGRA